MRSNHRAHQSPSLGPPISVFLIKFSISNSNHHQHRPPLPPLLLSIRNSYTILWTSSSKEDPTLQACQRDQSLPPHLIFSDDVSQSPESCHHQHDSRTLAIFWPTLHFRISNIYIYTKIPQLPPPPSLLLLAPVLFNFEKFITREGKLIKATPAYVIHKRSKNA